MNNSRVSNSLQQPAPNDPREAVTRWHNRCTDWCRRKFIKEGFPSLTAREITLLEANALAMGDLDARCASNTDMTLEHKRRIEYLENQVRSLSRQLTRYDAE